MPLSAKPCLLKEANLSLVRSAIQTAETSTRAEIVQKTGLSSTTVRSLLSELLDAGEIEHVGYDASSGGRKAERYRLVTNLYYGAAICTTDSQMHCLLVDVYGKIADVTTLEVSEESLEQVLTAYLDTLIAQKEIRAIGIGVPGVVDGGFYWKKRRDRDALHMVEIGDIIERRYGLPVVLENDLNATAIGFGHCYEKEFPAENPKNTNMAYLHFEKGCVSAGFLSEGRLIRGAHNFAGELGLVPLGGRRPLDESMSRRMEDKQYIHFLIEIISWICGILNPQYVALGGPDLRKDCIGPIADGLFALLPSYMFAELLYAPDRWQDYHEGMAYLTAEKMFERVQFVKK